MPNSTVQQVDRGFNAHIRNASELPPGSAAEFSENILYSRRTGKTPFGFEKLHAGTLPLSGPPVLGMFIYTELDGAQHLLAVTTSKVYRVNNQTSAWEDITQSGVPLDGSISSPVSHVGVLHTDGLALNGSGDDWFVHSVISTGGISPVQRWAGKFEDDYADLKGADGYHQVGSTITNHFALQVGLLANHVLLVSPRESDANDTLKPNDQNIRFSVTGKLETWTGTGSGNLKLLDTNDVNVWGALLGRQWIQYQQHSIWSITHVGGSRVFAPNIEMPDLGLLSAHLLHSKNKVHYFIGNDFNVYAYIGGSATQIIGDNIHRFLQRDLSPEFALRSWLTMGASNSRLWLYIVPNGSEFATQAYGMDILTGAWMKRDLTHKFTTTSVGVSAVALVGSGSFTTGKTYREALLDRSPSKVVEIGGCVRSTNVVTCTTTTAHAFVAGETAVLADVDTGGETDAFSGSHTIASVPGGTVDGNGNPTTFTFSQTGADEANLAEGTALVDKAPTSIDYQTSAITSRESLTEVLTSERIALGDNSGNVYQFSDSVTTDDGIAIPAQHFTEVYDHGNPAKTKLWPPLIVTAKGTSITISYRTGNFETEDTGWIDLATQALTSEFTDYTFYPNDSSKRIQLKFSGTSDFQYSAYGFEDVPQTMAEV